MGLTLEKKNIDWSYLSSDSSAFVGPFNNETMTRAVMRFHVKSRCHDASCIATNELNTSPHSYNWYKILDGTWKEIACVKTESLNSWFAWNFLVQKIVFIWGLRRDESLISISAQLDGCKHQHKLSTFLGKGRKLDSIFSVFFSSRRILVQSNKLNLLVN